MKIIDVIQNHWFLLLILIIVGGMSIYTIVSVIQCDNYTKEKSEYCEGFCKIKQLEYSEFQCSGICYCKKCDTKQLLGKNVSSCEYIEFNLEIE